MIKKLISKSKKNHLGKFFLGNYLQKKDIWTKINDVLHANRKILEDITVNGNGGIITNQEVLNLLIHKQLFNSSVNELEKLLEFNSKI